MPCSITNPASTTAAIRTTILCLLTNPTALSKLRAEIDSGLALDVISTPIIRNAEACHLPYLQAIIKEEYMATSFRLVRGLALIRWR